MFRDKSDTFFPVTHQKQNQIKSFHAMLMLWIIKLYFIVFVDTVLGCQIVLSLCFLFPYSSFVL
jgi:UPF0716 family protein affecting phage T7 exclusion